MQNYKKIFILFLLFTSGCATTQNPEFFHSIKSGTSQIEALGNNIYKITYKGRKNQNIIEIDNEIDNIIISYGKKNNFNWYVINDIEIARQNFRDLGAVDGGLSLLKIWANYKLGPQNSPYGYKYYQFPSDNKPLDEIEYEIIAKSKIVTFGRGEKPFLANIIE